jgi:PAS domain S-box-containing protein
MDEGVRQAVRAGEGTPSAVPAAGVPAAGAPEPEDPTAEGWRRDPAVLESLRAAVSEAARLLEADGAIVYLVEPEGLTLRWACDAGISDAEQRRWMRSLVLPVGTGMYGMAVAQRAVRITHDYTGDQSFPHAWMTDAVVRNASIRSMCVAPLLSGDEVLGALGVYSARAGAFGEGDAALVRALADHAAATTVNIRLIAELDRARSRLEHQADAEAALRRITMRITATRAPDEVLQQVVDEARRLLGADGAHLSLMAESRQHLVPFVVAGGTNDRMREWLRSMRFPVGGGINGLAALHGAAVTTVDYLVDPRIPHTEDDQDVARRMGLRAMAAVPLRGRGGEVTGTLAISYEEPRPIEQAAVDLLQGLADQASIVVSNARVYADLAASEERYRYVLEQSPDLPYSTDADGRFTFLGPTVEQLLGWRADELLGRHFSGTVDEGSKTQLAGTWSRLSQPPFPEEYVRTVLRHRDGRHVTVDIRAVPIVVDGTFVGSHGAVRDVSDQERLAQELRARAAELAAEQERARLARELHDSVTQALFSMTLTTRSIELLVDRDPAAAEQKLAELRELEHDALAEMRALILELRPATLQEDGLVQALRTHAASVQGRTGIVTTVEAEDLYRHPPAVEEALYRIAQEALHNVVKHAGAKGVRIELCRDPGGLLLSITDDGRGFDPDGVGSTHLGLAGMRTRAAEVGGRLRIESRPGAGTRVECVVPVPVPVARRGGTTRPADPQREAEAANAT